MSEENNEKDRSEGKMASENKRYTLKEEGYALYCIRDEKGKIFYTSNDIYEAIDKAIEIGSCKIVGLHFSESLWKHYNEYSKLVEKRKKGEVLDISDTFLADEK